MNEQAKNELRAMLEDPDVLRRLEFAAEDAWNRNKTGCFPGNEVVLAVITVVCREEGNERHV